MARWDDCIEPDLQDLGIDVHDPAILTGRSWPWLRTRILGLLTRPALPFGGAPNRLLAALLAERGQPDAPT